MSLVDINDLITDHPLWSDLMTARDQERERVERAQFVVKGADLQYELTPQGYLKWYLHPSLEEPALRSMIFYEQMIPPHSRSGLMQHPGELIHLILEGHGEFTLNGVAQEVWSADCVILPVTGKGVQYQFRNLDAEAPFRFVAAMPNLFDALGVDMGGGFEVISPAPEYNS